MYEVHIVYGFGYIFHNEVGTIKKNIVYYLCRSKWWSLFNVIIYGQIVHLVLLSLYFFAYNLLETNENT